VIDRECEGFNLGSCVRVGEGCAYRRLMDGGCLFRGGKVLCGVACFAEAKSYAVHTVGSSTVKRSVELVHPQDPASPLFTPTCACWNPVVVTGLPHSCTHGTYCCQGHTKPTCGRAEKQAYDILASHPYLFSLHQPMIRPPSSICNGSQPRLVPLLL
jgi:hypothetical protein